MYKTLLKQNQPDGFDCPGCAWPDREHASTFEFCENGVKAVGGGKPPASACAPTSSPPTRWAELLTQSDYELEQHGRLTDPVVYDSASDKYLPIAWDDAFALIARHLKALPDPNQATFYVSGRTGNEAAFLLQLFVRMYGTNNFPDLLEHVPRADQPRPAGHRRHRQGHGHAGGLRARRHAADLRPEPGHQPPAHAGRAARLRKRGATIVSINPLRERAWNASPAHRTRWRC